MKSMVASFKKRLSILKKDGLANTTKRFLSSFSDYFFDLKYGIETFSWMELDELEIDGRKKKRANMYQPTCTLPLRRLLRKLNIPPGKILVDLGCGKGIVLMVASEFGFREIRGIEISPVLCDIALRNCSIYKEKTKTQTDITIVMSDVIDYGLNDDEDVFYLFNPFDEYVLWKVLENIMASLQRRNREILIIYRNAVDASIIEGSGYFTKIMDYAPWGWDFMVFSSSASAPLVQPQNAGHSFL
jgi:SAM-dependent methyltransferase